ncbi:O-antigen ligase family protein [Acidiferrimicrobium sp. IK]|uniref:O-antigen ligase family protein n=1 Tax=Acidiferrimicrobium sp. IK TaxID=2871700 RepID=UPI0021CB1774|nr:O-antigen ligase family protein [Acidiferrimicrobium sp. IK]MCU4183301.1 O-antigen ligase family protein [Acidiferrimicrobium sp. IK]
MRRPARVLVLAALPAVGTLVVDPSGWSPFGPARWAAVLAVTLAGAALALPGRAVAVGRRGLVVWGVWLAWVAVAAAVGMDGRLAWIGTPQRHFGALTWGLCALAWLAGHSVDDDGDLRVLAGAATAVCGAIGVWSIAELLGWQPVALAASGRLVGPLGNADYLGAATALLVPVAVGVAADGGWAPRWRAGASVCAGAGYVALIGAGARAAWVGVVAGAAVLALARRSSLRRLLAGRFGDAEDLRMAGPEQSAGSEQSAGQWWSKRAAAAAIVVLAATGATFGLAVATGTAGRLPAAVQAGQGGGASRLAEWSVALRVVAAHPVTGTGPEGYRLAFGAAVGAGYQRTYGRDPLPDRAHDSLLDVAATTGLPGLGAYLALLAVTGALMWRALRKGEAAVAGMAVGLVAYSVGALFLFPVAELEPTVWLLAGVVGARVASDGELVRLRVPRLAAPVVVAAVVVVAFLGVRAVTADRQMRVALADPSRGAARAARAAHDAPGNIVIRLAAAHVDAAAGTLTGIDRALGQVAAARRVSPADPVVGLERAQLLEQRAQLTAAPGDWRAALDALAGLARRDPRNPAVLVPLGVAEASSGHTGEAVASWLAAARLAPSSPSPEIDLAVFYFRHGQPALARGAAERALALDPAAAPATAVLRSLDTARPPTSNPPTSSPETNGAGDGT